MKDSASSQQADDVGKEALLSQALRPVVGVFAREGIQLVPTALLHFHYPCWYPGNCAVEHGLSLEKYQLASPFTGRKEQHIYT